MFTRNLHGLGTSICFAPVDSSPGTIADAATAPSTIDSYATKHASSGVADEFSRFEIAKQQLSELVSLAKLRRKPTLIIDHKYWWTVIANCKRSSGIIGVSKPALKELDDRLLKAVLAHEVGHISHFWRRFVVRVALPLMANFSGATVLFMTPNSALGKTGAAVCLLSFGLSLYSAINLKKWDELTADIESVRITGDPEALIDYLTRYANQDPMQHLRIENLRKKARKK